jgi:hypothetical protein
MAALATQAASRSKPPGCRASLQALAVQGERERIAREMHDGLAQVLGYVNTKSQAVEEMLPPAGSPTPRTAGRAGLRGALRLRGRARGDPEPLRPSRRSGAWPRPSRSTRRCTRNPPSSP